MNNRALVIATIVGTGSIVLLSDLQRGKGVPDPSTWIALAALYLMLGFAIDLAPAVAVPVALIVFAAVVFSRGEPLLTGLTRSIKKRKFTIHEGGKNA